MTARADLSVLIPAAGQGLRLGRGPKAVLAMRGRPVLSWLAEKAQRLASEVVISAPPDQVEAFADWCPGCVCIAGGSTRQDSVALLARASSRDWLLLQDVSRPFVSTAQMAAVLAAAGETGCAGAFLMPEVPVARIQDGRVRDWYRRDEMGIFQSPQVFARQLLLEVIARAEREGWQEQSTLQLALRAGVDVRAVAGEKTNIKLTTEEDWIVAQQLADHLA